MRTINKKLAVDITTQVITCGVFFKKDNFMDFDFKTITQDIDNKLKLTWRALN